MTKPQQEKTMQKTLSIKGMSCQNCVKRINKIIAKEAETSEINVNLDTGQATFHYEPKRTNLDAIVEEIKEFGFEITEIE